MKGNKDKRVIACLGMQPPRTLLNRLSGNPAALIVKDLCFLESNAKLDKNPCKFCGNLLRMKLNRSKKC